MSSFRNFMKKICFPTVFSGKRHLTSLFIHRVTRPEINQRCCQCNQSPANQASHGYNTWPAKPTWLNFMGGIPKIRGRTTTTLKSKCTPMCYLGVIICRIFRFAWLTSCRKCGSGYGYCLLIISFILEFLKHFDDEYSLSNQIHTVKIQAKKGWW